MEFKQTQAGKLRGAIKLATRRLRQRDSGGCHVSPIIFNAMLLRFNRPPLLAAGF